MLNEPPFNYHAYLVRFWRAGPESVWRVILRDPYSDKPLRFDSLVALYSFLQTQLGEVPRVPMPAVSATNQDAIETKTTTDSV